MAPSQLPGKRLELDPILRLRLADEIEYNRREDRLLAVETVSGHGDIAVHEQVLLDHGLEGRFVCLTVAHGDRSISGFTSTRTFFAR